MKSVTMIPMPRKRETHMRVCIRGASKEKLTRVDDQLRNNLHVIAHPKFSDHGKDLLFIRAPRVVCRIGHRHSGSSGFTDSRGLRARPSTTGAHHMLVLLDLGRRAPDGRHPVA
jgi:hypothetical protein